jgi:hypothetical protein
MLGADGLHGCGDRSAVAHVHPEVAALEVAANHARALREEVVGDRRPDAPPRAGHQHYLPLESPHASISYSS